MSGDDAALEDIRKRRLQELQQRSLQEQQEAETKERLEEQKHAVLRQLLTPEARQRLANLKMVKPDFASQLELQIIQIAQTGRVNLPMDDEQLKEILKRLRTQKKEIHIRRI